MTFRKHGAAFMETTAYMRAALVFALALLPACTLSRPLSSEAMDRLEQRTGLSITTQDGQKIRARQLQFAGDTLHLTDREGARKSLSISAIRCVTERRRGLGAGDGFLIGMGTGALVGFAFGTVAGMASPDSYFPPAVIGAYLGGFVGLPAGAVIGTITGTARGHRTCYRP